MIRRVLPALAACVLISACDGGGEPRDPSARPDNRSEEEPAELPSPRTEVAGAAWDGRIVVVGGLNADGSPSASAHAYDPNANEWQPLPELPIALHHTAVVAFSDRVWVIGGFTADLSAASASKRVFSLGAQESAWREEPSLTTVRGALAAAATPKRIVAGGGVDASGVLASTEFLDAGSDAWSPGPAMAQVREHFAMTAVEEDVYAIAGRAPDNFDSVEILRGGAAAWDPIPGLNRSRGGIGAANVEGVPCVAGGEEPAGTIAPIECLRGGKWEAVAEMSVPRHGLAVVALGSDLHVVSGGPQPGLSVSGEHEVFTL